MKIPKNVWLSTDLKEKRAYAESQAIISCVLSGALSSTLEELKYQVWLSEGADRLSIFFFNFQHPATCTSSFASFLASCGGLVTLRCANSSTLHLQSPWTAQFAAEGRAGDTRITVGRTHLHTLSVQKCYAPHCSNTLPEPSTCFPFRRVLAKNEKKLYIIFRALGLVPARRFGSQSRGICAAMYCTRKYLNNVPYR